MTSKSRPAPHPLARKRETKKRVRLSPETRLAQILESATRLVSENGFFGVSLQDIADDIGITQAGLLHYIHNKEGLLELLVKQRYDTSGTPAEYQQSIDQGSARADGLSFPGYCRFLVNVNSQRPQLMKLYMVLGAEAATPSHPAYEYFVSRPDSVWELYKRFPWRLPPSVRDDFRPTVERVIEVMDGIQVRFFRNPPIDLNEEWARFEPFLFPSPIWDGYR